MSTAEREEAWKALEVLTDLYKYYVTQSLDFHKFYIPAVGALAAFLLGADGHVRLAALFPIIVSFGAFVIFFFGIGHARELSAELKRVAETLGILPAHSSILERMAATFAALHVAIMLGGLVLVLSCRTT